MPDFTKATDKGGELWDVVGFYGTNAKIPRSVKVKHYNNDERVFVSIGPPDGKAKGTAGLSIVRGEELAEALYEACEKARQAEQTRKEGS